jgi:predicted ester cyclase
MQLTWNVVQTGPKKSITFNLQGLDSYTNKQVAYAQGTGSPSFTAEIPVLLEEAVISHMDNFTASLQAHFDDMFANGREVTFRIKKLDAMDGDLTKEFNGKELNDIIEAWVYDNAVKHKFNLTNESDNMMYFEQIRMPMYDESGKALDAKGFFKPLSKMLEAAPYNIPNKPILKGLGQVSISLGDK